MTIDKVQLKALAEASLVGDWYESGDLRYEDRKTGDVHGLHHDDDRFIAAASPTTVLAMLAEIEHLQDLVAEWRRSSLVLPSRTCAAIIDQLKAENEALRKSAGLAAILPQLDEALEDLELHGRHTDQGYRKLKDWYRKVKLACDSIDAAMAKEASHG